MGRQLLVANARLRGALSDLEGTTTGMWLVAAIKESGILFTVDDGAFAQSDGQSLFGQIHDATLIGGCSSTTGYRVRVSITIDIAFADDFPVSDPMHPMTSIPLAQFNRYMRQKDLRLTLLHELLHAAQYVMAVEARSFSLARLVVPLAPEKMYTGGQFPPPVGSALGTYSDQHPRINELEERMGNELGLE